MTDQIVTLYRNTPWLERLLGMPIYHVGRQDPIQLDLPFVKKFAVTSAGVEPTWRDFWECE